MAASMAPCTPRRASALQQQRPRHAVVGPLQAQEAADERLPQVARAVEQVLQREHRVQRGHGRPEARLRRPAASVYATSRWLSSAA